MLHSLTFTEVVREEARKVKGFREEVALPLSCGIVTFSLEDTKVAKLHGWILLKEGVRSFPNTEN